ncbi:hypothetical protein [Pseudoalteromonas sp. Q18-MNA-CIBAN-0097]|uniref:hypothetical protein n=1 Tax=Pseudoalteromonas sp. Q18-MNA-CIBAN-0097 TaxID=3140440 RepID=UPI00332B85EE
MFIDDQEVVEQTVAPVGKKKSKVNKKKTFFKLALTDQELELMDTIVDDNNFVHRTNYLLQVLRTELDRYKHSL